MNADIEGQVDAVIQILADQALAAECARRGIDIGRLCEIDDDDLALLSDLMSRGRLADVFAAMERMLPAPREFEGRA